MSHCAGQQRLAQHCKSTIFQFKKRLNGHAFKSRLWETGIDIHTTIYKMGFPGDTSGKEPICHCRKCMRCGFDPWVRKIPWRRAW